MRPSEEPIEGNRIAVRTAMAPDGGFAGPPTALQGAEFEGGRR